MPESLELKRARRRKYMRAYRKANQERLREQERERYKRNPDKIKEKNAEWCRRNPDKARERNIRWRARHLEKARDWAWKSASRARARKKDCNYDDIDRREVLRRFNGRCGICGRPIAKGKKFHIDHIVPLEKGGEHSYANTQPAHPHCNLVKGKKESYRYKGTKREDSAGLEIASPRGSRTRRTRGNSKR